jgi:tRNA(Ile)-lysidine synthase
MPRQIAVPDPGNPCLAGVERLLERIDGLDDASVRVGVAFSGGADSTALLHAMVQRYSGVVVAIHVHHGLQAAADGFASHCQAQCAVLNTPFVVTYVNGKSLKGESPEDAARRARYIALAAEAKRLALSHIVLAQHADDQVETFLLALTRGAGLPGLAAMPDSFERFGVMFHRPLLSVSSRKIRDWLKDENIQFVDDPSNLDESFTRNRIRRRLIPVLEANFPGYRNQVARSARHAAQGKRLLESLAQLDLAQVGNPPLIASLRQLETDRQANTLRYWLMSGYRTTPSDAQLQELVKQVVACTTRGHRIHLKVGAGHVQRDNNVLVYLP